VRADPFEDGAALGRRGPTDDDPCRGQRFDRRPERREVVEADQQIGQAQTSVIQPCLSGSRPY
jgi:hypothetical protein